MAQDEVPQQNDSPRPQDAPRAPTGDELALRRRVSDLEREDVAERLREAAGEGRLSYTELEERLETVYGAKTYGDLVQITADLPNGLAVPNASAAVTSQYSPSVPATAPVMVANSVHGQSALARPASAICSFEGASGSSAERNESQGFAAAAREVAVENGGHEARNVRLHSFENCVAQALGVGTGAP